jgi:hypothetical protein
VNIIHKEIEYSFMLQMFSSMILELCLGVFLQMTNLTISTNVHALSISMSVICFVMMMIAFTAMYIVVNKKKTILKRIIYL